MTFVNDIESARKALDVEIGKLQSKADAIVSPMKKYEPYPKLEDYNWSAFHTPFGGFKHGLGLRDEYFFQSGGRDVGYWSWDNFTRERYQKSLDHFQATYEQWKEDSNTIIETNLKIKEHNDLQRSRVFSIMGTLGVRETYSTWTYKTNRSRNKTESKHKAGYLSDLERITPTDDYQKLCKMIESKYDQIKRFGEHKLKEADAKRAVKEKEELEIRKTKQLALLQAKYTPNDESADANTIINIILSKNKYLRLAYWLERNRGDWTSGYDYAELGLDSFTVETETDKEIEAELSRLINEDDDMPDGRIFRDCEWNYTTLYGMVEDQQLLKDLEKAQEIGNEW